MVALDNSYKHIAVILQQLVRYAFKDAIVLEAPVAAGGRKQRPV